jgi:hypothetical protein
MTPEVAYGIAKRTYQNERAMREKVFRDKPRLKGSKLAEIDRALQALEVLREAAGVRPSEQQNALFE